MLGSAVEFPHAPGRLERAARVRAEPGWLVLSPFGFMQNFLRPHPVGIAVRDHGEIANAAGTGRMAWIDARDVAASAAAALAQPLAEHQFRDDYLLTGPRALSSADAATVITEHAGRPVHVKDLTVDQLAARHRAAGLPAAFAGSLAEIGDDVRAGRYDEVTTSVLDLTGQPARTFEDFAREHAAEWQPNRQTEE